MLSGLLAAVLAVAMVASAQSRPDAKPKAHPSPAEQTAIIDDVRNYALKYSQNLPDYICTQVTERYVAITAPGQYAVVPWRLLDTLTIRLSYFDQKENYKLLLVNNTATQQDYSKLVGATSEGDFGSMMSQVFEPATEARFQWDRSEKLRGRSAYVFAYQVSQARSQWHIKYEHEEDLTPAYRGMVHVDQETRQVLRVSRQPVDIPTSFPVRRTETTLDYDYQMLGGQKFLLPLKSEVLMAVRNVLTKNENEFRQYHKYSSESDIKYDTAAPAPPDQTREPSHR